MGRDMGDAAVLFVGERDDSPLCASLCVVSGDTVYGRYWGTRGNHSNPAALRGLATTSPSTGASRMATNVSKAALRARTNSRAACCRWRRIRRTGWPMGALPMPFAISGSAIGGHRAHTMEGVKRQFAVQGNLVPARRRGRC